MEINRGTSETKRRLRGPRRIEFVPPALRSVPGVEHLTTARQLNRLGDYLNMAPSARPPFIRLGCSVAHGDRRKSNPPNATWAVTVNGAVSVVYQRKDPRSSWKFMTSPERAWNIEYATRDRGTRSELSLSVSATVTGSKQERRYYVVSLATEESDTHDDIAIQAFTPNMRSVWKVWQAIRPEEGIHDFLIEGRNGWWFDPAFDGLFFNVREATGEVFTTSTTTMWVTSKRIVEVPAHSFADVALMTFHGRRLNLHRFLEIRAVDYLRLRVAGVCHRLCRGELTVIRHAIKDLDLTKCNETTLDGKVDEVVRGISALKDAAEEVFE